MTPQEFHAHYRSLPPKRQAVVREKLLGKTNKEIAESLNINSEATVRRHLSDAYQKFGLSTNDHRGGWAELQSLFFQLQPQLIPSLVAPEPSWVGRETDFEKLRKLVDANSKILLIVGEGGIGKTTLADRFLASYHWDRSPLTIKIAFELGTAQKYTQSAESQVQRWLQQEFNEQVPRNFMQSLGLLEKKLRAYKIPIFIDNLETIIRKGIFLPEYRDYVELLRVISDPAILGFTLITSREKLKEPRLSGVKTYALPSLTLANWQGFFGDPEDAKDQKALELLHKACHGNAKAMELLGDIVKNGHGGNIHEFYDFWQRNYPASLHQEPAFFLVNDQLKFIIDQQFSRISAHSIQAHQLLCRLAVCRYQAIEWLPDDCVKSLLWDVTSKDHLGLIHYLCDASLVQFSHGKYRIHAEIRAAALSRLKTGREWQQAHRSIAEYWFNSTEQIQTSQQGWQTLEAYHHFMAVEDYDAAWGVLRRPAMSILPEELFLYFLSWGFIRDVLGLAQALVGLVSPDQEPSLYRCLGDCHIYLLEEGVGVAIDWHQRAQQAAQREADVWTEFNSYSDLGLCYFAAGEYQLGLDAYQAKLRIALASNSPHIQGRIGSCYCEIALLASSLERRDEAIAALANATAHLENPLELVPPWQACWDLNMAGLAQKNIGEYLQAQKTLEKAIEITTSFNFGPDRARSWYILGDVYRGLKDFATAITYQEKAIEFFTNIGAKYELAESYNYLGLTYQELQEFDQAKICYQEAIAIFTQIKTLIQVDKSQSYLDSLH